MPWLLSREYAAAPADGDEGVGVGAVAARGRRSIRRTGPGYEWERLRLGESDRGLVEDDDARAYGRYDARQTEHPDSDRRYGRYEDSRYATDFVDDGYADEAYGDERYPASRDRFGAGYAEEVEAEELPEAREPEPVAPRRPAARPLGLAPAGATASPTRMGGTLGGATSAAGAAGLAVREPVAAEPEPAPAPKEPYRIFTVHPRTYNEARTIGERFRDGSR